jgi:predicted aspartyl protease
VNTFRIRFLGIALLCCVGISLPAGDVIHLSNGREITGVITGVTPAKVTVEMQGMTVTLAREDIVHIQSMGEQERAEAIKKVRQPLPHQEDFYPKPARSLFHSIRRLTTLETEWRYALEEAESSRASSIRSETANRRAAEEARHYRTQRDALPSTEGRSRPQQNQIIDQYNAITRRMNSAIQKAEKAHAASQRSVESFSEWSYQASSLRDAYVKEMERAATLWEVLKGRGVWSETGEPPWQEELTRQLSAHPGLELAAKQQLGTTTGSGQREIVLPPDRMGHYSIPVLLNGIVMETMLVDTGATMCLLPESVGKRAGAQRIGPPVRSKVADGRTISVYPAVLDVVEIYGQQMGPVQVGLLPDDPSAPIMNLLGMNVLSAIPIRLTSEGLVLTITPDE